MTPEDFIYKEAHKRFMALGGSDSHSGYVASEAVRMWKRNTKADKAIEEAVKQGKKTYKPKAKA